VPHPALARTHVLQARELGTHVVQARKLEQTRVVLLLVRGLEILAPAQVKVLEEDIRAVHHPRELEIHAVLVKSPEAIHAAPLARLLVEGVRLCAALSKATPVPANQQGVTAAQRMKLEIMLGKTRALHHRTTRVLC